MSYEIKSTQIFEREAKFLIKKYASLTKELRSLIDSLAEQPIQGTPIANNCYKIRLAIKSKGKGKSGGARVISCIVAVKETVILVSIYDKSEQLSISNEEIEKRLKNYVGNL